MPTNRILRVNQLIRKELSGIILREIEFPEGVLVTLTRVETLGNLQEAAVFISVMPEDESAHIFRILNKLIYFLQQKLNRRLKMRPLPKIRFVKEEQTAEAGRIEGLLERVKNSNV